MTNSFTWNLAGSGAWNVASNWPENGGTTAASTAPGAADVASFAIAAGTSAVVTGPGAGSVVDFEGPGTVDLAGTFDFGSVVFGPYGLDMAFKKESPARGRLTALPVSTGWSRASAKANAPGRGLRRHDVASDSCSPVMFGLMSSGRAGESGPDEHQDRLGAP